MVSGEELVARYHRTRDVRDRDRAVERYMPLARRQAQRHHRGSIPLDDLMQIAFVGLVRAVDRFDPGRGNSFATFAIPTISGELLRYFRDNTWTLHVPRAVKEDALHVTRASAEIANRLGREPTISELSQATGLDPERVSDALYARAVQSTSSLDQARGEDDSTTLADVLGAEDPRLDLVDHVATAAPLFRALPERDRKILHMRFVCDMTQTEIAEQIGCSQMQVSRLLRRSIARLSRVSDEPQEMPVRRRSRARAHRGDAARTTRAA